MIDNTGTRQLCYLVKIDEIRPIEGKDRVECAVVGGWAVMVQRGKYQPGSIAVYFEIDSKVPADKECFAFLEKYHYKVKTQKFKNFYSQGLLMGADELGWTEKDGKYIDDKGKIHSVDDETRFVTKELGVIYADPEDNKRKANSNSDAKINAALGRHPHIAKKYGKFIKNHKLARKIFLLLFGRKRDNKTGFPTQFQYVKRSDEERCENMTWILENKTPFVKTTKIDGTSTLFILERKPFNKTEFYVCSRNIRQLTPDQKTYHTDNVYWQVEFKYHIKEFLNDMLKQHPKWNYVALQGETAGISENGCAIQGNPHKFNNLRFFGYNFIDPDKGRWGSIEAKNLTAQYGIEWVPVVDENYILPDNFEEFKLSADGPCEAPGASGMGEGYVYRNVANPNLSFKNVSRKYLLKHN